jgi:hypothetical protein
MKIWLPHEKLDPLKAVVATLMLTFVTAIVAVFSVYDFIFGLT